eukprot:gene10602-12337_t
MEKSKHIGATFLLRYYTVLSQNPESLKNFYSDKSVFSRRTGTKTTTLFVGAENIHQEVMELGFLGCKVSITALDCQQSLNESIFIACSGVISKGEEEDKSFTQSFFLEKSDSSYVLLNDIFSYVGQDLLDDSTPDEATSHEENHVEEGEDVQEEEEEEEQQMNGGEHVEEAVSSTKDDFVNAREEVVAVAVAATEKQVEQVKEQEEETNKEEKKEESVPNGAAATVAAKPSTPVPVAATPVAVAAPAAVVTPTVPSVPKTYAEILANTPAATSPAVASPASSSPSPVHKQPVQPDLPHREGCTLFVSFMSTHSGKVQFESPQLKSSFSKFGHVNYVRVLKTYAFVEFDKPEYVQQVLAHIKAGGQIMVDDNAVVAEPPLLNHKDNKPSQAKVDPSPNKTQSKRALISL